MLQFRENIAKGWRKEARRCDMDGMHIMAEHCEKLAQDAESGKLDPPLYRDASQYSLAIPQ